MQNEFVTALVARSKHIYRDFIPVDSDVGSLRNYVRGGRGRAEIMFVGKLPNGEDAQYYASSFSTRGYARYTRRVDLWDDFVTRILYQIRDPKNTHVFICRLKKNADINRTPCPFTEIEHTDPIVSALEHYHSDSITKWIDEFKYVDFGVGADPVGMNANDDKHNDANDNKNNRDTDDDNEDDGHEDNNNHGLVEPELIEEPYEQEVAIEDWTSEDE